MNAPTLLPAPPDSPIEEDGPADPDRSWRWRDIDDGAFDDDESWAAAKDTVFGRVTFLP